MKRNRELIHQSFLEPEGYETITVLDGQRPNSAVYSSGMRVGNALNAVNSVQSHGPAQPTIE